jgi:transposase
MNDKKPAVAGGSLRERERRAILETLNDTSWNISEAARRLEIGRSTLHRKIKRYGLRRGQSLAEMSEAQSGAPLLQANPEMDERDEIEDERDEAGFGENRGEQL